MQVADPMIPSIPSPVEGCKKEPVSEDEDTEGVDREMKQFTPLACGEGSMETVEPPDLFIPSVAQRCKKEPVSEDEDKEGVEERMETVEPPRLFIPFPLEGCKKEPVSEDEDEEENETTDSSITPPTGSKRKRRNVARAYTDVDLKNALDAVKTGMPVKTAANLYKIPKTTLLYKKRGILPPTIRNRGPECILGEENENKLVQWILHMSRSGFPPTRLQLLDSVQLILKHLKIKTQLKNNRPGRNWCYAFKNRHPEIVGRTSEKLTRTQADLSEKKLRGWFSEVQNYFQSKSLLDVDATRVFSCHESAFFLSPKGATVLTKKGDKTGYNFINNDERECLTTLICESASGELAPPMVLFPYKRIPGRIAARMPKDWSTGHSDSGWMTGVTFFEYVANVFYRWLRKNKVVFPVILFVDGNISHSTMPLTDFCREKAIELVVLDPNASHILQPLDVAFFHPLKGVWENVVRHWRLENNGQRLKREDFAPLLQKAIEALDAKSILKNAFKTTGLHPFSADGINCRKFFKNRDSSEKIPPVTQSKRLRHKEIVEYVESNIETEVLEMFKDVKKGAEWRGDLEHLSLFSFWRKIKGIGIAEANEVSDPISANSGVQAGHVDRESKVSGIFHADTSVVRTKKKKGKEERLGRHRDG